MPRCVDVAIVGGGIAGSSLATLLARTGFSTVIIERETAFRDRIRGEGLHPWGAAELHRVGLAELLDQSGANPLPIWQSYEDRAPNDPFHWADVSIDGLPEYGVHHPKLQDVSIRAAAEAGATIYRPAKVVEIRPGLRPEIDVEEAGVTFTISAKLLVGADGRRSLTRRSAGIKTLRDPPHHRFGGVLVQGVILPTDTTHEVSFPGGRVFVLPQRHDRARAYIVTASDQLLDVQVDHSGAAAIELFGSLFPTGSWHEATIAGPIGFFSNEDEWAESIAAPGVVLIGDAAGANDPSVGNGLSLVFRDVRILSELLLSNNDWQGAIEQFACERDRYFQVVREHARWLAVLTTEIDPERDERITLAREQDPSERGFAAIFARGPDGLVADESARRAFFGEETVG